MANYSEMLMALPASVRAKYQESSQRVGATKTMEVLFGLDEMREEPRIPRTQASREARIAATNQLGALRMIHDGYWSSLADPGANESFAKGRGARYAKKQLATADAKVDFALRAIEEEAKRLKGILSRASEAPSKVGEAMVDSEVRALIRAEPDPHKQAALAQAHPRAVATAPALASGVPDAIHAAARRAYLATVEPEALADNEDLQAALTQLKTAHEALHKEVGNFVDMAAAERAEKFGNWQEEAAA